MAQRLMGVVNGLQMLEDNFLAILMEAALKLASLTEVPLFIMCETAEGRRYAGRGELCDLYRNGTLQPQTSDVEMEINPSPSGVELREKPSPNSRVRGVNNVNGGVNESLSGGEASSDESATVIEDADIIPLTVNGGSNGRKRSAGDSTASSSWPGGGKIRRQSQNSQNSSSHHFHPVAHFGESFLDNPQNSVPAPLSLDDHGNWDDFNQPVDVKAFGVDQEDDKIAGGFEHSDDGVALPPSDIPLNYHLQQHHHQQQHHQHHPRINGSSSGKPRRSTGSGGGNTTPRRANSFPASFTSVGNSPESEANRQIAISNFDLKVEALKQISGDKFEQTNSDEFRLMSSCMYEFGRNTAEKYMQCLQGTPDLPHRPFFIQEYEHWASQFVNVHPFGNVMIKKENRESKRTLTAYMRKIAGDAFGICIRKKMKKQNLFLPKTPDPFGAISATGFNSSVASFDHSLPFDSNDILT